jgi:hypothetical protein
VSTAIEELDRIMMDPLDLTRHKNYAKWKRKWLDTARGQSMYPGRQANVPELRRQAEIDAKGQVAGRVALLGCVKEPEPQRSMLDTGPTGVAFSAVFVRAEPRNV